MTRRNTRDQRLSYRVFPHFTMFCREETHDERLLTVGREWSELLEEEPHSGCTATGRTFHHKCTTPDPFTDHLR